MAAVLSDFITWKVKNEIIFCGLAAGMYFMFQEGTYISDLLGMLVPIVILWPLFYIRALGAGDLKLFAVLGSFYGYKAMPSFIIVSLFFGAILSIFHIVRCGNLNIRLQYFYCYISNYMRTKKLIKYYDEKQEGRAPVIHFSLAIGMAHLYLILR